MEPLGRTVELLVRGRGGSNRRRFAQPSKKFPRNGWHLFGHLFGEAPLWATSLGQHLFEQRKRAAARSLRCSPALGVAIPRKRLAPIWDLLRTVTPRLLAPGAAHPLRATGRRV